MKKGFSFSYWIGKLLTLGVLVAPVAMTILPLGWENITLGVVLHGVVDFLNQKYHAA